MLALHTSDWHLGRSLHGHSLGEAQAEFVDHLVDVVRAEHVDVVLLSGDVHDRALPPVEAMKLFDEALRRLRDAGAAIVAISGNHDAPARLGDKSALLDPRVVIRTDPARVADPVVLADAHGKVAIYPIPYLEPTAASRYLPALEEPAEPERGEAEGGQPGGGEPDSGDPVSGQPGGREPGGPGLPTHAGVLRRALAAVHADRARRGGRSVVLAHAWVTGASTSESERAIGVGGVGNVAAALFEGVTYAALGHLHRPQSVTGALRYSGSPLPYSFSEAGDVKTSWLVELDANGLGWVEAIGVPAHRKLSRLTGRIDDLMTSPAYADQEDHFVAVTVTDPERPVDAMSTLQRRFPYALTLVHEPDRPGADDGGRSYTELVSSLGDQEIAEAFVTHVRTEPRPGERRLLSQALAAARRAEGDSQSDPEAA